MTSAFAPDNLLKFACFRFRNITLQLQAKKIIPLIVSPEHEIHPIYTPQKTNNNYGILADIYNLAASKAFGVFNHKK